MNHIRIARRTIPLVWIFLLVSEAESGPHRQAFTGVGCKLGDQTKSHIRNVVQQIYVWQPESDCLWSWFYCVMLSAYTDLRSEQMRTLVTIANGCSTLCTEAALNGNTPIDSIAELNKINHAMHFAASMLSSRPSRHPSHDRCHYSETTVSTPVSLSHNISPEYWKISVFLWVTIHRLSSPAGDRMSIHGFSCHTFFSTQKSVHEYYS